MQKRISNEILETLRNKSPSLLEVIQANESVKELCESMIDMSVALTMKYCMEVSK